jgi:hypothetical protein
MDISIACSDRSPAAELQSGQAAAARPIVASTADARAAVFFERRVRSALRSGFFVTRRMRAPPKVPIAIEEQPHHRDTTYGSHASGSCSSAA